MEHKLVFALSGGGSRGSLQVGALYALLEYGLEPDLLIGASVGAVNSAFLALNGFTSAGLDQLTEAWRAASAADLMSANYIWLAVRALFKRSSNDPSTRLRDFFIQRGLTPELTFADVTHPSLVLISADLNVGKPILYGTNPTDKILEALMLSTRLPPWFMPVVEQDRYLVDGAIVSNLPIEPALTMGATQIVALDLIDSRELSEEGDGVRGFLNRLVYSVERRQLQLELELAEARGVPVLYIGLGVEAPVPIWDFSQTNDLIVRGYETACHVIESQYDSNPILSKQPIHEKRSIFRRLLG
jgi:NTE family protein